jgi:hypothetical protein
MNVSTMMISLKPARPMRSTAGFYAACVCNNNVHMSLQHIHTLPVVALAVHCDRSTIHSTSSPHHARRRLPKVMNAITHSAHTRTRCKKRMINHDGEVLSNSNEHIGVVGRLVPAVRRQQLVGARCICSTGQLLMSDANTRRDKHRRVLHCWED